MKKLTLFLIVLLISSCTKNNNSVKNRNADEQVISHSQGEMAGLITHNSVLLQTRLTDANDGSNFLGAEGWVRFYLNSSSGNETKYTQWKKALPENDYIVKIPVENLEADMRYIYKLNYGSDTVNYLTGEPCQFKTLPGNEISEKISFAVVTGMNYAKFYHFPDRKYTGSDAHLGYPAAETILKLNPDFFVGTGDNVYYDSKNMPIGPAIDMKGMRTYYHLQFSQPRMVSLFSNIASYWEKDDHDYRYNDCDTTGDREPSHELGIKIFREQLPVVNPNDKESVTYGTYRVSKEIQIWILEGRDYRSPNKMPDGPQKSIWGNKQKEWLKKTLLESNALFKLLISPTPLIGPDDSYKSDNHVNQKGFRYERDVFFGWLVENGISPEQFMIICGDRHWQYHSIHNETGYNEFSCGAFVDANSRLGRKPGDPKSTDPDAVEVTQAYTQGEPSGGFLLVRFDPSGEKLSKSNLIFQFMDEMGKQLYSYTVNK